ncbi:hypothetical protein EVB55_204 [Rhizobium phage RHph_Y68]|uniref:Uncharacterized protein n=1 Tax=Rhizobium phage RHph_Y68 TaxID=2509787 RepID=A0A7S5UT09_9CAUD|nr:hypothetical protein PP934_gp204 [Rhizobium phage RHph_Y68]QIG68139.1 hypothetical protein EVB55_204 [Rhizobium phage RHph_Y68]
MFKETDRVKITNEFSNFYKMKGTIVRINDQEEANFPYLFVVKLDNWKQELSFQDTEMEKIDG